MLALLLAAQAATPATPAPAPSEIVAAAKPAEWVAIAADDLLVMDLAPDARGRARRVLIQLMPAPFSQGWVGNIRVLARARWWDGLSVNRVQDNYVVQWGDADAEDRARAKPLPAGLRVITESEYVTAFDYVITNTLPANPEINLSSPRLRDAYAAVTGFVDGWPVASSVTPTRSQAEMIRRNRQRSAAAWPVHCYAMVGVGRGLSPDTGSGAELYTVIGHAPRHLDRNIALVGRVLEGIEHLSSLPRGTEALGFYKTVAERTVIRSVRLASALPEGERPRVQYLSTESASFAAYADARANRRDAFFIRPAGGADVCNVPVPVRRVP